MGHETLDDESKTGHSPVAEDDISRNGNDLNTGHLSSVVEQRFRKPLETPTAADGSSAEPVKARIEADGGDEDPVDVALWIVDQDAKDAGDFLGRQHAVDQTLAAEVRRLREALGIANHALAVADNVEDELRVQLDNARDAHLLDLGPHHKEIATLREQLEAARAEVALMGASLKQQDDAERVLRTSTEAAASKLSAKLARVEALPAKWRAASHRWNGRGCAGELEAALRDEPQPEREPKLPYNGY